VHSALLHRPPLFPHVNPRLQPRVHSRHELLLSVYLRHNLRARQGLFLGYDSSKSLRALHLNLRKGLFRRSFLHPGKGRRRSRRTFLIEAPNSTDVLQTKLSTQGPALQRRLSLLFGLLTLLLAESKHLQLVIQFAARFSPPSSLQSFLSSRAGLTSIIEWPREVSARHALHRSHKRSDPLLPEKSNIGWTAER
jgi:hypothetical protein